MKNGCLGAATFLLLGAGGFWLWTQTQTPRVPPRVKIADLPAVEQKQRRAEARQLEDQVQSIARAARQHEKKPFSLEVSDEQLNTLIQDRVDLSKFPVRELSVGFVPDAVVAEGKASLNGFQAAATLQGEVKLEDGSLVYTTQSLQIGGLPAPGAWKSKLDSEITKQLNQALKRAPGRIESVQIEQGKMIVSGQTD